MNADLETNLAVLTSSTEMQRRALELGFRPVQSGELDYVAVSAYVKPEPAILATAPDVSIQPQIVPPEYTQSLLEWFNDRITDRGLQ